MCSPNNYQFFPGAPSWLPNRYQFSRKIIEQIGNFQEGAPLRTDISEIRLLSMCSKKTRKNELSLLIVYVHNTWSSHVYSRVFQRRCFYCFFFQAQILESFRIKKKTLLLSISIYTFYKLPYSNASISYLTKLLWRSATTFHNTGVAIVVTVVAAVAIVVATGSFRDTSCCWHHVASVSLISICCLYFICQ